MTAQVFGGARRATGAISDRGGARALRLKFHLGLRTTKTISRRTWRLLAILGWRMQPVPWLDPGSFHQKPDQETLKAKLTAEQYQVTQEEATERPFHNAHDHDLEEGIYVEATTGEPLFFAKDKFQVWAVDGQVSPVPLPKMSSTITRTIAMGWSESEVRSAQAIPSRPCPPTDLKTRWLFAIASIRPHCALFQKRKWSKKVMVIY